MKRLLWIIPFGAVLAGCSESRTLCFQNFGGELRLAAKDCGAKPVKPVVLKPERDA